MMIKDMIIQNNVPLSEVDGIPFAVLKFSVHYDPLSLFCPICHLDYLLLLVFILMSLGNHFLYHIFLVHVAELQYFKLIMDFHHQWTALATYRRIFLNLIHGIKNPKCELRQYVSIAFTMKMCFKQQSFQKCISFLKITLQHLIIFIITVFSAIGIFRVFF